PLVYVSLERQNKLHGYRLENGTLTPEPIFARDTLAEPGNLRPKQIAGTLHVHPFGGYLYLANRSDATSEFQGPQVDMGGETNIAVFALDSWTGEPKLIQDIDAHGFHPRTFALNPTGDILVVANITPRAVRDGDRVRTQPATLSCYPIGGDGKLAFVRSYDI